MFKIIQRHTKLINISQVSQTIEVRFPNTSKLILTKRNHHIWNGRQQHFLCTSYSFSKNTQRCPSSLCTPLKSTPLAATFATLPEVPELPPVPVITDVVDKVATSINGEPTFASMGLGGWSPVGIIQNCMEYAHVTLDLPWWGAIVLGTVCVRLIMLPVVIKAQRNNAVMHNNLPQIQHLQMKMSHARKTGNQLDSARYGHELMQFMKEKGVSPIKSALVPLVQAPFFISFFMGLRGMANCPVESLSTGGLFWFADLTLPDQFYLLPIITSVTLWITIEIGADGARLNNASMMKYFLRAIPVVMFPFIINFPGAILCYWVSTNFISLTQVAILKIPKVRAFAKLPKLLKHDMEALPIKSKGFVSGAKESWTNMKLTREIEDRLRVDEMIFNKAGKGPLKKTYKFDPTKVISAKKSES